MESIREALELFTKYIWPQWPGFMFIIVLVVFAQNLKTRILTAKMAATNKVIFWIRRIFPTIILVLGVVAGLVWPGEVVSGVDATFHKVLYFTGCSGISIVGFNVVKQWVKKKYDVDLGMQNSVPPE